MPSELFESLVYNISLLLVLVGLYSGVWHRSGLRPRLREALDGLIIGVICLAVMANPWTLRTGLVFDVRSILLGIAGLFFGAVPALIAAAMAAAYRVYMGGIGLWTGLCVIIISVGLGLLWRRLRPSLQLTGSMRELYLFGLVLHILMLAAMFLLPWATALETVGRIALPVLVAYPLGTVLLGVLLVHQRENVQAAHRLAGSEAKYKALFDNSNDAVFFHAMGPGAIAGKFIDVNSVACERLGYTREELLQLTPVDIDADGMTNAQRAALEVLARTGHALFEMVHAARDGRRIPVEISSRVFDYEGTPHVLSVARDITERKLADERLKKLSDQVPGVIYQYRLYPDGRSCFPYSSSGMNDIYERTPEEVREDATPVFGRIHPDDIKSTSEAIFASARDLSVFHREFRVVLPRQGLRWRMSDARPERLPDGGTLWYGIISDITDRKSAEAERERLMTAIDQAAEMVVLAGPAGEIKYVNPAFELVTGYARGEVTGKNISVLKSGKQDDAFYKSMWEALSAGRNWEGRMVNKRKDGTLYTEESTISPVKDPSGRIVSFVAVKRDITEQMRLEGQLLQSQKMEAVGLLAGGIAHDFNNILTAIKGYCSLIVKTMPEGDANRADMGEIMSLAERAAMLTSQLLAFSRKQIMAPKVIDLNATLGDMSKMLRRVIGEEVSLSTRLSPGACMVKVDPAQMEQVLMNLVLNARDAVSKGGRIELETEILEPGADFFAARPGLARGRLVCVRVRDNGCGMDAEAKKRIFEPFYTTKEHGKGTGLGLPMVYGTVKQSGGEIDVASQPGEGTVFTLYFPVADPEQPARPGLEAPPIESGTETILLVEDEDQLRRLGERLLRAGGYTVISAENGKAALEAAARHGRPLDLLLTDVVMPGMGGRELALALTARGLVRRVIYMSGYTEDTIVKHGVLEAGIAFVYKPFTPEALYAKIRAALDGPADQAKA
ncbi:MAG: hypothetical protein A2X32_04380 [Elusimicrobia bacterium GWC2_64_44]|nr:MAG: hypothetical protein A2X32_04380 [Elusimicrobia bacterium GWC2_64_44]